MAQIKFYLERRKNKKGEFPDKNIPIILKYSFNGQRFEYFTGIRCDIKHYNWDYWKSGKSPFKTIAPFSDNFNRDLEAIERHIRNIESDAISKGVPLTVNTLRTDLKKLLKPDKGKMTLTRYFDVFIESLATRTNERTGAKLSNAMSKKYGTIKNLFIDFCSYMGRHYDFTDIDSKFFSDFKNYMITEKQYAVNTYGRAIKFLKTILNDAVKNKHTDYTGFRSILKGVTENSDSVYLTMFELQAMYELDLSNNLRLERIRDIFLIGCWTGLRFSDFTTLKKEDIQDNRIRVKTQKTKSKVVIPLHPVVKSILEKYQYQIPPAISNQKFNQYLKEVAQLAGIDEPFVKHITKGGNDLTITSPKYELVTSHVARRSFASNAYTKGINPVYIMAITGHKTESEFMKYIKLSEDEKANEFEEQSGW